MSLQALSWVFDYSRTGGNDRLVMLSLGNHADTDGYVAVSRARLAAETRLDERTVKRVLDKLLGTAELAEADESCTSPAWWLDIRPDRRPRLLRLPLFAMTRPETRGHDDPPRPSTGGGTGGERGGAPGR